MRFKITKTAKYASLLVCGLGCINILLNMETIDKYLVEKKAFKNYLQGGAANPIDYIDYNNHSLVRNWKCDAIPAYQNLCSIDDDNDDGGGDGANKNISLLKLLTPPRNGQIMDWIPPSNDSELDDLYLNLIEKILKPFPSIKPEDLKHLMVGGRKVCEEPLRFKYEERQIYVDFESPNAGNIDRSKVEFMSLRRWHPLFNLGYLNRQLETTLGDFEGVICLGDEPPQGPGFSLVWNTQWVDDGDNKHKGIPFPLMEFSTPLETWDETLSDVFTWRDQQTNRLSKKNKYRWEYRYPYPVFRGGMRSCNPEFGDELARPIYNKTLSSPSHIPDYSNCGRELLLKIANHCGKDCVDFNPGTYMSMKEQEQYKAIMQVEGHAGWANRLAIQLAMKNVIIRQFNMPYEEWYSSWLQPWVHYVPVDHLFTYLPFVNRWCQQNDESLLKISSNADKYAQTFLPVKSQLRFLELLLREYSKRYQLGHNTTNDVPQQLQSRWVHLDDLARILVMYGAMKEKL